MIHSPFQPAFEGRLTLTRTTPGEQAFYANVLVQIFPVDALALADQSPIAPLLCGSVQEPGIPGQWHRDSPTIVQLHRESIICDLYPDNIWNLYLIFTGEGSK